MERKKPSDKELRSIHITFLSTPSLLSVSSIDTHILKNCVGAPHGAFLYILKIPYETFHDLPPVSSSRCFFGFTFSVVGNKCSLSFVALSLYPPLASPSSRSEQAWPGVALPDRNPPLPTEHICLLC